MSLGPAFGAEEAVIVHFSYGSTDLSRLFALEDKLTEAIERANAGEFDGDEIAVDGSDGVLFMYGPSADKLLKVIKPILETIGFMNGAVVTRRYGSADSDAREISDTIVTKTQAP